MLYYLIVCRSLTHAQRTAAALERAGVTAHTLRSPKSISSEGCGYCVRVATHALNETLATLKRAGLEPKRIFSAQNDGTYEEVRLI